MNTIPCGLCLEDIQMGEELFKHGTHDPLHAACIQQLTVDESGGLDCPLCRGRIFIEPLLQSIHQRDLENARKNLQDRQISPVLADRALRLAVQVEDAGIIRLILQSAVPTKQLVRGLFDEALSRRDLEKLNLFKPGVGQNYLFPKIEELLQQNDTLPLALELLQGLDSGLYDYLRAKAQRRVEQLLPNDLENENWERVATFLKHVQISSSLSEKVSKHAVAWGRTDILITLLETQGQGRLSKDRLLQILDYVFEISTSHPDKSLRLFHLLTNAASHQRTDLLQAALTLFNLRDNELFIKQLLEKDPALLPVAVETALIYEKKELLESLLSDYFIPKPLLHKAIMICALKADADSLQSLLEIRFVQRPQPPTPLQGTLGPECFDEYFITENCRREGSLIAIAANSSECLKLLLETGSLGDHSRKIIHDAAQRSGNRDLLELCKSTGTIKF